MKIVIYGIDAVDFRCGGCAEAKRILDICKLPYEFKRALTRDNDGFPKYDLDVIDELQSKGKFPTRSIRYPVIFIDDCIVNIKNLKTYLESRNIDISETE